MQMLDDNEDFCVGDDDPDEVTYTIDVPQFMEFARERLIATRSNIGDDFEPRIFADRVAARISPTRSGKVVLAKEEIHRRVQLVLEEIDDDFLRARVAHELLELLALLNDVEHAA
jgi:hypothetical protein